MLTYYIQEALNRATYEMIEDEEPFYGEISELQGVWASGNTLEICRRNLAHAVEDWLVFSLAQGLPIPPLGDLHINPPVLLAA